MLQIKENEQIEQQNDKRLVRQEIDHEIGDLPSNVGTISDGLQWVLYEFSKFVGLVSKTNSVEDIKQAALDTDKRLLAFAADVDDGHVKLTCHTKNLDGVMIDIKTRSTGVSEILISKQQQDKEQ